jgi:hypothetical protein
MATLLDTRMRATAERLIAQYGKAMTLRRQVEGTYNPATANASIGTSDYAVIAVVSTPSNAMLAAGLAQASDLVVMLAAKPLLIEPAVGDILIVDGAAWRILYVRAMFSGEQIATYELLARK